MLSSIRVRNFLSYEDAFVDMRGASTEIVGDNGHGKSALLETIPFALYGMSRYQYPKELARLQGDGTFDVIVEFDDIPNSGDHLKVSRGLKKSGYATVHLNGDIVAKGSNEVTAYIENLMGVSSETFMLTSFFGLGDNKKSDPLLKVEPATCLETLQKIAKVFIYTRFHKGVKDRMGDVKLREELLKERINTLTETMSDPNLIETALATAKENEAKIESDLKKLRDRRAKLDVEEAKYRAIVRDRDKLEVVRDKDRNEAKRWKSELEALHGDIISQGEELNEMIEERRNIQKTLAEHPIEYLQEAIDIAKKDINKKETMLKLKEVGVSADVMASCPLCDSPITDAKVKKWKADIAVLNTELEQMQSDLEDESVYLSTALKNDKRLNVLGTKIDTLIVDIEDDKKRYDSDKQTYKAKVSALKKLDTEYAKLCDQLGSDYQKMNDQINVLNSDIENYQEKLGSEKQSVINFRDSLKDCKETSKKLKKLKRELKELKHEKGAMDILEKGFSRYGIPLQLLGTVRTLIEDKATEVYKTFNNGSILIEDVEGGRPGVRFVLVDQKGSRAFSGLSLGERAMFFIAVRVAVADIVNATTNMKTDFLVLDEGLANLSERNRDNLVKLINKVLRKTFPQVLVVTHVPMQDIFTKSYRVQLENGVSVVC